MLNQSSRAFFLLTVLLSPALIGFFAVQIERSAVRREVKHQILEGIDKDRLELISISRKDSDELRWEHSKEFEYQGEMYDVVYMKTTKDSIQYWCWWDHKETALNKELSALLDSRQNQSTSHKNHVQLIVFFQSLYAEKVNHWELKPDCTTLPCFRIPFMNSYKSRTLQVTAPPPQA